MSDRHGPGRAGSQAAADRHDALAADSKAERDRLRERLHQVEINVGRIDEQHGRSFRDRIDEVRRKLAEAERDLEQDGDGPGRGKVWSSLSAEIADLEARLRS